VVRLGGSSARAGRTLSLYDSRFQLRLEELPMLGSPGASNVIVSLFDYTCHHCQIMHGHLAEAQRRLSNELAVVSLPTPFDSTCNPAVKRTPPAHVNGCEYARFSLAVWRTDRAKWREYDDWLFRSPNQVPVPEARAQAEKLIGKETLERALGQEWIRARIQEDVELWATNYVKLRRGELPQLIVRERVTFGPFKGPDELLKVVQEEFGLKPAGSGAGR
jgi:hypothetical protein